MKQSCISVYPMENGLSGHVVQMDCQVMLFKLTVRSCCSNSFSERTSNSISKNYSEK